MNYTKGKWSLLSKEFQERNLLGKMLLLDAKKSDIGAAISELENQYILEKCLFKKGEKVLYKSNIQWRCGIVWMIYFDVSPIGWRYHIEPRNKDWGKSGIMKAYHIVKSEAIKKAS
ncbi:hypothetical protein LCGC14_2316250 [marine sediment metagenome]|uniref:Uncharacterized protein n=1 Tax=marine sediment metagenome TaxID=412755 RepID=A0A0F9D6P4_9ZZZZ